MKTYQQNLAAICKKLQGKTLTTDGKGFWSNEVRKVRIYDITIERPEWMDESDPKCSKCGYCKEERYDINVYFTKKDWNVRKHGLIYTDDLWEKGLRTLLKKAGWSGKNIATLDDFLKAYHTCTLQPD